MQTQLGPEQQQQHAIRNLHQQLSECGRQGGSVQSEWQSVNTCCQWPRPGRRETDTEAKPHGGARMAGAVVRAAEAFD